VEGFLRRAQGWQYYYNVERPHFGVGMNGKSPLEKLRELGWDLPDEFACFPVILLDEVAVIWASKGGHDVLAYYSSCATSSARCFEAKNLFPSGSALFGLPLTTFGGLARCRARARLRGLS